MPRLTLLFGLCLAILSGLAAQTTIDFTDSDWSEALEFAAAEGKPVFLYAYSPGCRYCRQMEREVFPDSAVAAFYNATFVNYRVDITDDGAGTALGDRYGIERFPTYLYLNARGEPLHQSDAAKPAAAFLADAEAALDPDRALFPLMRRYATGERDPDFLYAYVTALVPFHHPDTPLDTVLAEYLETQSAEQLGAERNLRLFFSLYPDFGTPAADYLLANQDRLVPVFGEEEVRVVTEKIIRNAATNAGRAGDEATLDAIRASARKSFPDGERVAALAEITYLQGAGDWSAYATATLRYAEGPGTDDLRAQYETAAYLNAFAEEEATHRVGATLMEGVTQREPNVEYLTLYAELLHKAGDPTAAKAAARRAVEVGEATDEPADQARELLAEW